MSNVKQKKNKKINVCTIVFYSIYALFVIAIIVGIFVVMNILKGSLDEYERSLEKYEAEDVFNELFVPCDFERMYDMQSIELSEFETKEDFVKYMKSCTDGKEIVYTSLSAGTSGNKKYSVKADDVKFAEFTLKKTDNPATPEDTWALDTVTTFYTKDQSVGIEIYKTSTLYLNGKPVQDSYITKDDITTESCEHLPEGVTGILNREYYIDGLLLAPTLKTVDRHGNESTLVYDEEKEIFIEQMAYDVLTEDITKLATNAAQTYSKYMTLDATIYNLDDYLDRNSKLFQNIASTENKWYTPHVGYEFKDNEVKEYYVFDENTFSVRFTSSHIVYRTYNEPHEFKLDFTLYFKNVNGNYLVYDMVSNG